MDGPALFDASVPVLLRYLASLSRVVSAAEESSRSSHRAMLVARLAPDMLPFHSQVETAAQFAFRTAFPLAGRPVPPFVAAELTFEALQQKVVAARQGIDTLRVHEFSSAAGRLIREQAGSAEVVLPAQQFLGEFALPNFFFHLSMAYAIARANGAALGKGAYDGFHTYASGA